MGMIINQLLLLLLYEKQKFCLSAYDENLDFAAAAIANWTY